MITRSDRLPFNDGFITPSDVLGKGVMIGEGQENRYGVRVKAIGKPGNRKNTYSLENQVYVFWGKNQTSATTYPPLVCTACHGKLSRQIDLQCPHCGASFPVIDRIPGRVHLFRGAIKKLGEF